MSNWHKKAWKSASQAGLITQNKDNNNDNKYIDASNKLKEILNNHANDIANGYIYNNSSNVKDIDNSLTNNIDNRDVLGGNHNMNNRNNVNYYDIGSNAERVQF